ncbi:MAG: glutathione S-transferase [Moraxellaceae bacterium]|nr:MAG: glutathione S-transferase [Moraxellaceae bacterium]
MTAVILHNYHMSPFSEKIRAMFGYTQIQWSSVRTKEMPPRPLLQPLTGGYRKIPVMQIGADVFCDTRTITTELASITNKPELALENCDEEIQDFVHKVDLEIFFACIIYASSKDLRKKATENLSYMELARLVWDRLNMGRTANVKISTGKAANRIVTGHIESLQQKLQDDFLYGQEPNIADFSAYHSLWFIRDLAKKTILKHYPSINTWMDRIKHFGNGQNVEMVGEEALLIAKNSDPRSITIEHQQDPLIGRTVSIAPNDYGQNPTKGQLVGATATQWIVSNNDKKTGLIHIHFPKYGFDVAVC